MIDKRFKVHSMIQDMEVGEVMDLEVCEELIKKYGSLSNGKRFELRLCSNGTYYVYENGTLTDIDFDKFNQESAYALIDEVNALYEDNEQLKQYNTKLINKIDFLERIIDGDVE